MVEAQDKIWKELLNDFEHHLNRGKRTYGNLIGEMRPIPEEAFKIIDPSINFNQSPKEIEIIDKIPVRNFLPTFSASMIIIIGLLKLKVHYVI